MLKEVFAANVHAMSSLYIGEIVNLVCVCVQISGAGAISEEES